MSDRFHADFRAYALSLPPVDTARIFSLKVEHVDFGNFRRRYVDALLVRDEDLVPVPFIYLADGGPILHEKHASLAAVLRSALLNGVAEWIAGKAPEANMEADLFETGSDLRRNALAAADSGRPLLGLTPYDALFTEAERYANLTPYVWKRSVIDFNPGLGYGLLTLAGTASSLAAAPGTLPAFAQHLNPKPAERVEGADVAVWLDAAPGSVSEVIDRLRSSLHGRGLAIASTRSAADAEAARSAGMLVAKFSRPAADALGAIDEWLCIAAHSPATQEGRVAAASSAVVSERPLRVLFGLRPSSAFAFGGDVVQIRETAKALEARGHYVEISAKPQLDASGFDVVHLSNLTVPGETLPQAQSVSRFAGPVVMMPIFTDHADEAVWGMRACTTVFAVSSDAQDLQQNLDRLAARSIGGEGWEPPPRRNEIVANYTPAQRATLDLVDYLIPNAHTEAHRIYRYLNCSIPYSVAPSSANPRVYGPHARAAFVERFGIEDFLVLPGRYEARKNQLMLFEAARGLGFPVVYIGVNNEPPVAKIFRLRRPDDAIFIGHLPESELAGAFAAARMVAIPSWSEVVSLTSLNAAISGASMVLSRNSCEHEYFADDAEYCDPGDVRSIRSALVRAWQTHDARRDRREALAERVLREYTWEQSARMTEAAYYRALAFNPRGEARRSR